MEWHIITGSKGGIGKTLITLLLLAYNIENKGDSRTLVLDLNGMNADTFAVLKNREGKPITIELPTTDLRQHENAEQIIIQKAYSLDSNKQRNYYAIGYPLNPFGLYNPLLFSDLLSAITESAVQIEQKLGFKEPLQYIIIDTNYHFCNLFSQDDTHYTAYTQGTLQNESINIWFMWVYRQLNKLIDKSNEDEAAVVIQTADAIENNLKSQRMGQNTTPFVHVFNPVALLSSRPDESKQGILTAAIKNIVNALKQQNDYSLKELEKLEQLPVGEECMVFEEWLKKLEDAGTFLGIEKQLNRDLLRRDPFVLFLQTLFEAINTLSTRPMNVIPLPVYQHALQYYTDRDLDDIISSLRRFKIYSEHFSKLMWW
jgi:hypothetical protein